MLYSKSLPKLQKKPKMDALQRVMNTFKQFERKLDKIQADVNFHGHALTDLKSMITSLSTTTIVNPDVRHEFGTKGIAKRSIASQYEESKKKPAESPTKKYKNNPIPTMPATIKGNMMDKMDSRTEKPLKTNRRATPQQHLRKMPVRPKKGEVPRKVSTIRSNKLEKKANKLVKEGVKAVK